MKRHLFVILFLSIFQACIAFADPKKAAQLTAEQKAEIAKAIKTLTQTGALKGSKNKCMSFDEDVLEMLEREGLLDADDADSMSICGGLK
jgi:hypothetical protein